MKIIKALENIYQYPTLLTVFLAGGITGCPEWQDEVIKKLDKFDDFDFVVYNPRRKNFPIDDPDAALEQITWEFNALEKCDVFSMWFSNANSDQPICMYELGRNLALFDYDAVLDRIAIGVEPGYKREQDVKIQTELVSKYLAEEISNNLEDHVGNIIKILKYNL